MTSFDSKQNRQPSERNRPLDVMRGAAIAMMILVNTPGSWEHVYRPLRHAAWHGCTPTDLVFPFFLFVVGASIYFSMQKFNHFLSRTVLSRIARRSLLIFAIGLFLNAFPPWKTVWDQLRIMGVLQRIALTYAFGSLLILTSSRRRLFIISVAILLSYWCIIWFFGGPSPYSLGQNAVLRLDRLILSEAHLYKGYGLPFDPEGLLGTLPAVVTLLIGYGAACIIAESPVRTGLRRLFLAGLSGTLLGWIWGWILPMNKALWTSSYVLYTGGLAALFLGVLTWIIEVRQCARWTFFLVVFGKNPLFLFALAGIWGRLLARVVRIPGSDNQLVSGSSWLYQTLFVPLAGNLNGSLLYALAHVAAFWLIGWLLHKKNIIIKV